MAWVVLLSCLAIWFAVVDRPVESLHATNGRDLHQRSTEEAVSRSWPWKKLDCPSDTFGDCEARNHATHDVMVSLFFQFEGTRAGSFACTGTNVTYCSRSYREADQGSAGTCVFLLAGGSSMRCVGKGANAMWPCCR